MKKAITTNPIGIKRIIEDYYKQFYVHRFDNLDKMDQFLERHKQPNLTKEET